MNTVEHVPPTDGQCGTCYFAKEFGYASSPSGPEDGVHCTSYQHAVWMDQNQGAEFSNVGELMLYGFMDLYRLEALAEETHRCPNWMPKVTEIRDQTLPAPDEAPLTTCPWCGKEYNVQDTKPELHYETLVVMVPGTHEIARHNDCGKVVRFIGYEND